MSLKYKEGDRFKRNQNDVIITIEETNEKVLDSYLIPSTSGDGGISVSEYHLDAYYTKIEPEQHVWENHPSIDKPSKLVETEYNGFKDMTASFGNMLNEKNKRYGNAALDPLVIVGKHHRLGAKIDEKLSRIMNADELKKNDLSDVIGYCFLICKDMGWTDFSDQLD